MPAPASLPIDPVLPELRRALASTGCAVLEAPPGAGKTTRVPLALLDDLPDGRIVVLEPRRVAARAAAARMAATLGEPVGATVGLTTRDERRRSAATRIEVVTDGVVLRRLQRDPALAGVAVLLLDEVHERHLEADLVLAFAIEVRAALREDLRLLLASATLDGERFAALLGPGTPVVRAEGRSFPVTVEHRASPPPDGLIAAVGAAVLDALADHPGDVLVFLPGAGEIRRVGRWLADRVGAEVVLRALHGSLPATEQDRALTPDPAGRRRVVLSTDVAESGLTVPGVRVVVDAGRAREPRFDAATGMTGLVTVAASQASAAQRAGRAGRTAPGHAVRLWAAREHPARDAHPRAAIRTDDLTRAALEVAAWGADVADLALLDAPPAAAWERATATLVELGALDRAGRVTAHGRELAALPVHPRLGHLLLAARAGGDPAEAVLATELAALLLDRDVVVADRDHPLADVTVRVRLLRGARPPAGVRLRAGALGRARRDQRRLARQLRLDDVAGADPDRAGGLIALGWPERVARRRTGQRGSFRLAVGRGAELPAGDALAGEPWLAVAHLDRGREQARIHLAAPLDPTELTTRLADAVTTELRTRWHDGDVESVEVTAYGGLELARRPRRDAPPGAVLAALLDGLRREGLDLLDRREEDRQLVSRVALLRRELGPAWPDLADAAVLAALEDIVGPFLLSARRRADLRAVRYRQVLRSRLAPGQLVELDRLAPTHLELPSGARRRIDHTAGDRPVLAVRVQELFGASTTPCIVDGRVPVLLHLLSPASRPVQVTDDLAGFWARGYPQVRAELRGRYPRHPWPEDPTTATPVRGTGRRRR